MAITLLILNLYSFDMNKIYGEYLPKYFFNSVFTLGTTVFCLGVALFMIFITILQMVKGSCCKLLKHCLLFISGCLLVVGCIAFMFIFVIGWIPVDLKEISIDETHRHQIEKDYDCCYESYLINQTTVFADTCQCQYFVEQQNVLDSKCSECMTLNDYQREQKTLTIFNEIFVFIHILFLIGYIVITLFYSIPYFIKVIKKQKWYDEI